MLGEEHGGAFRRSRHYCAFSDADPADSHGPYCTLIGPAMEKGFRLFQRPVWYTQSTLLMVVPTAAAIAVLGRQILGMFGAGFTAAYPALLFLLWGYATWAIAGPASTWLQYGGKGNLVVLISVAALILDCVLNLILIPRYGLTGAAMATAIAFTLVAATNMLIYRVNSASLHVAPVG
ncbi:MAG: polysaccharide biosynthesis C-terminal domain-containing protein [Candidatus Competibacteraceae bacterium]